MILKGCINKGLMVIALILGTCMCALAQEVDYSWKMYDLTIPASPGLEEISNDSEALIIAGDGIEIGLFDFTDIQGQNRTLEEFAVFLRKLFRLEDADPIYPMTTEFLNGYVAGGYKEFSRIVIFAFDTEQGRFFATATFDEDDLDAEKEAIKLLKAIRSAR